MGSLNAVKRILSKTPFSDQSSFDAKATQLRSFWNTALQAFNQKTELKVPVNRDLYRELIYNSTKTTPSGQIELDPQLFEENVKKLLPEVV